MDQATHNRIVSFLQGIADHVLTDQFRRGKEGLLRTRGRGDAVKKRRLNGAKPGRSCEGDLNAHGHES